MMRRATLLILVLGVSLVSGPTRAIDHRDGPGVLTDPSTDIANLYSWMSADGAKVHLALTVYPNATTTAKFSSSALYAFHVNSYKAYGDTSPIKRTIICRFTASQSITCWGPEGTGELLTGDASKTAGLPSASGKMKIFAGLRDDGTFFNLAGYKGFVTAIKAWMTSQPAMCPPSWEATAPLYVAATLPTTGGWPGPNPPGKDSFVKGGDAVAGYSGNVLALVVTLDKTLVTDATHGLLGVWASTNQPK